jgi:hypothetical protein
MSFLLLARGEPAAGSAPVAGLPAQLLVTSR